MTHFSDGMGLLHVHPKKHGAKDYLTFNFLHSTYPEYLCARHILAAMSKEEQTAFWKENISNPRFAKTSASTTVYHSYRSEEHRRL